MAKSSFVVAQASPPGAPHATVGAPAPEAGNDFPPFDAQYWAPQIIWLAIIFGVLYLVMSRIALPRVAGILETRRARIASDVNAAELARKTAEEAGARYDRLLADARSRAQEQGQATHAKLAAESESRRKVLEGQLNEKLAAADRQITDTKARAMTNVAGIATEAAGAIVERLLGRSVEPQTVARAVSESGER